jgi:hypothetical protein
VAFAFDERRRYGVDIEVAPRRRAHRRRDGGARRRGGRITIYDMCKSADRGMRIDGVRLAEKRGRRERSSRHEVPRRRAMTRG